jgi:hypothetical protein
VGEAGFSVRDGIIACHKKGVNCQAYMKKRGHWPKGVLSNHIDEHFQEAPLGHCESLVQMFDDTRFLVDWVSKFMSTHGMMDEIQDHPTYRKVDGTWKTFKYSQPFSHTAKLSIGLMMSIIAVTILLAWRRFGTQKWWPMTVYFHLFHCRSERCAVSGSGKRQSYNTTATILPETGQTEARNRIGVQMVPGVVHMRTRYQSD